MTPHDDAAARALSATLALAEIPFGAEDADSIHAVGRVLFERGDHDGAGHVFRLLALVAPTQSRSWTALASCHDVIGDTDRARALYRLALEVPDHDEYRPFAAVNKARLDLEVGDTEGAEAALEQLDDTPVRSVENEALDKLLVDLRLKLRSAS
jgi:Flp pilus assembly protein TadD